MKSLVQCCDMTSSATDRVEKSRAGHGPKTGHGPGLLCGPLKAWKTGAGHGPKSGTGHGPGHLCGPLKASKNWRRTWSKRGAGHGPGLLCGPLKAWKTGAGHGPKSGTGHGPGLLCGPLKASKNWRRTRSKKWRRTRSWGACTLSGVGAGRTPKVAPDTVWTLSGAGAGRSSNRVRRHLPVLGVLACGVFAGILRQVSCLASKTHIFWNFGFFLRAKSSANLPAFLCRCALWVLSNSFSH